MKVDEETLIRIRDEYQREPVRCLFCLKPLVRAFDPTLDDAFGYKHGWMIVHCPDHPAERYPCNEQADEDVIRLYDGYRDAANTLRYIYKMIGLYDEPADKILEVIKKMTGEWV